MRPEVIKLIQNSGSLSVSKLVKQTLKDFPTDPIGAIEEALSQNINSLQKTNLERSLEIIQRQKKPSSFLNRIAGAVTSGLSRSEPEGATAEAQDSVEIFRRASLLSVDTTTSGPSTIEEIGETPFSFAQDTSEVNMAKNQAKKAAVPEPQAKKPVPEPKAEVPSPVETPAVQASVLKADLIVDPYFEQCGDDLISLVSDLEYDGFSSIRTREWFNENFSLPELVNTLTAYVMLGNNFEGRLSKVVNKKHAAALEKKLLKAKFVSKKSDLDENSCTLSRLAISYAPILYHVRLFLFSKSKLPDSGVMEGTCDATWKDLAFTSRLDDVVGLKPWITEMGFKLAVAKAKVEKAKAPEKENAEKEQEQWVTIAKNGLATDLVLNSPWQETSISQWAKLLGLPLKSQGRMDIA